MLTDNLRAKNKKGENMYSQRAPPPQAAATYSQGGAPPPPSQQQYYQQFPGPPLPPGGTAPSPNYTGRFPGPGEPFAPSHYPGNSVHRGPPPPPPPPPPDDSTWNSRFRFQPPPRFDRPPPLPPVNNDRFPPPRWQLQGNQHYYAPFSENSYQRHATHERSEEPVLVLQNKTENNAPPKKTDDQLWVENWLQKKNIKKRERPEQKSISIPEAKKLFRRAYKLLEELEGARASLMNAKNESSDEWNRMHGNVIYIQKQLDEIQQNIDMEHLKKKCKRIALKRARLKRQRRKLYEERQEAEEQRKLRHEEIDQWQAALMEKELEKKREKELKAAADATLSEVRKKLSEARRCKEVLERLTKLRQVRKDAMERMGLYTATESDTNFVKRRDALSELMGRQLETYETEETALKVMLEAEAEESKEQIREQTSANKEKQEARLKTRLRHLLFGLNETPGVHEEIRPFWEYYTAADTDLQTFLTIRQQWDSYIVPDGSSGGSSVPPGWVTPSTPSDSTWESALKHSGAKT